MAPMTKFNKGTSFTWTLKAQLTFEEIKGKLTRAPMLALPCIDFKVECEASGIGIGGILLQEGRPLALFSEKLWIQVRVQESFFDGQ